MSDRSLNWLKFSGLVAFAFVVGLTFAGLLDLPRDSVAQRDAVPVIEAQAARQAGGLPGTEPLVALSDAFASVAEEVRPSVVFITSRRTVSPRAVPPGFEQFFPRAPRSQPQQGSGSGFVVSNDGYILTNTHVVEGADRVTVQLLDRRTFEAKVVGTDPLTDVALLKIDARNLKPAVLGSSSQARVGEWVLAVGNPLGDNLTFTVTSGIISAKGRGQLNLPNRSPSGIQDFIQTDAAINPGNSGGPLVNVRGEVIGINSAIASQTGTYVGYGFAIPIDLARQVMNQLIAHGRVERAVLGVNVRDADPEDAEYVGLREIRGVRVEGFAPNSPAERAGVRVGDIIIAVNGEPVEYTAQLQQVVGFRRPGESVQVEVARRGGQRQTYTVRLTTAPTETQLAEATPQREPGGGDEGTVVSSLGITVEPVTPAWIQRLDLRPTLRGLVVRDVSPDGPAYGRLFGAQEGPTPDIITHVEDTAIASEADLRAALRDAGSIVSLRVFNPGGNEGQGSTRVVRVRVTR
jgi:serine protease Do